MLQDIRYSLRNLRKTPGFVLVAIATLALGIGANTAMFSVVKGVLLSRLPYAEPERLIELSETDKSGRPMRVSTANFQDWQAQGQSLESLAMADSDTASLSGSVAPERVEVSSVSRDFFRIFGTTPAVGRFTRPEDHKLGANPVLVISHGLWVRDFAADAGAMGRTIRVNGQPFQLVGVMPAGFTFPERSDVWLPMELTADTSTRSAHNHTVYARVERGLSVSAAQADMNTVASRLAREYADDKDHGIRVVGLQGGLVGPIRPALITLLAAVGFVLLIACVNMANLQLARGSARTREMALRSALGAERGRLIRQLLTESALLALAGGCAGLLLAFWGIEAIRSLIPASIPRVENIQMDLGVLVFTLLLSITAALVFGMLPALAGSRADVTDALKEGSGKATLSASTRRLGGSLVVAEIAIAMILLVGAGLLIQTFRNLQRVEPGFVTRGVLTASVTWPGGESEGDLQRAAVLTRQALERVAAIPGVQQAGAISAFPIQEGGADGNFEIAGRPLPADPHLAPDSYYRAATKDYFRAMGIALVRGRQFTAADENPEAPPVAVVNQAFVQTFFPGASPIGQRIRFFGFDRKPPFLEIVGVVNDVRSVDLRKKAEAEVFVDGFQHEGSLVGLTLVIRGDVNAVNAVREAIRTVEPSVPAEFRTVETILSESVARQRFQMGLLSFFAGLALLLSALGIYGVQSYTVNRRTSELGIRLALGANRANVLGLIVREGLVLTGAGVVIGAAGALLLTRTLSTMLFGVTATDPLTFFEIAVVLTAVSLLACWLPARRAARTDPMVALRYE